LRRKVFPLRMRLYDDEVVVVRVGPDSRAVVVVHPVAPDVRAVHGPELRAAGAAATGQLGLPVVGVVAGDLVVLDDQVGKPAGVIGVDPVLPVVPQAVPAHLLAVARHHRGAVVVLDDVVLDHPAGRRVVVDHALVHRRDEPADGQASDDHVGGQLRERGPVDLLPVEHRAGCAEIYVAVLRDDLPELVRGQGVPAGAQPERRACRAVPGQRRKIAAGRHGLGARGRRRHSDHGVTHPGTALVLRRHHRRNAAG
jgi:hypothetical protein